MNYICQTCLKEPNSHSFKKIGEKNNINYFYTCPANASKYDDNQGILEHYKGTLNNFPNQKWIWIFDSEGFSTKHALNIPLAIDLAKLISQYKDTLVKINIINPTWHIKSIITITKPFLTNIQINILNPDFST